MSQLVAPEENVLFVMQSILQENENGSQRGSELLLMMGNIRTFESLDLS